MSTEATHTTAQIEEALEKFLVSAQAVVDAHMAKNYPTNPRHILSIEKGRKYARIVTTVAASRSVYCFVDLTNGNILKSESWKKPAKHSRGSIFSYDISSSVDWYGAKYLR